MALKKNFIALYKNYNGKSLANKSVGYKCELEFQKMMEILKISYTFACEIHIKNEDGSYVYMNMYEINKIIKDEIRMNSIEYPNLNSLSDNKIKDGFEAFRWYLSNVSIVIHFSGVKDAGLKVNKNADIYDNYRDYYESFEK
jgi:hypothetical protein